MACGVPCMHCGCMETTHNEPKYLASRNVYICKQYEPIDLIDLRELDRRAGYGVSGKASRWADALGPHTYKQDPGGR